MSSSPIVRLNVGGHRFETTRETLLSVPDSYFTALLSERIPSVKDGEGAYFIDRDGQFFAPLLTFLRTGELSLPPGVTKADLMREAKFFLIDSLVHRLLLDGQPIFRNRSALTYLEEHGETIRALISNSASMGETACPVLVGVLKDSTPTSTSRLPHWYHRRGAGSILILGCDGNKQAGACFAGPPCAMRLLTSCWRSR